MPQSPRRYEQDDASPRGDWLERLARFNTQFGRFVRDAFGVGLVAFALMVALAAWGWTDGLLLTPVAIMLRVWFGWGTLLVAFAIGYFGFNLLRRERAEVRWVRLISLELAAILTLGLLAMLGGNGDGARFVGAVPAVGVDDRHRFRLLGMAGSPSVAVCRGSHSRGGCSSRGGDSSVGGGGEKILRTEEKGSCNSRGVPHPLEAARQKGRKTRQAPAAQR